MGISLYKKKDVTNMNAVRFTTSIFYIGETSSFTDCEPLKGRTTIRTTDNYWQGTYNIGGMKSIKCLHSDIYSSEIGQAGKILKVKESLNVVSLREMS